MHYECNLKLTATKIRLSGEQQHFITFINDIIL